ncbi:LysE family translocator [Desulfogranum japonicum]|uniref:LysE family translocator n=1 Tax=Desulfogranum japonicum TaxID=231447 RepID=UPI0003F6CF37|nr:LysE family translocator [Desulfogranum japonicum]
MEFLLIAGAHFLALLSPGPDFFLILQTALRMRIQYAIAVCAGIAAANAVYLTIAVLGLEVVREMHLIMQVLRYLGSGYLIYIGFLLLRSPKRTFESQENTSILRKKKISYQFGLGFSSAILNPKNAIFYLSLFTAMVSAETGLGTRILYALWMTSVVLCWDIAIATAVGNTAAKRALGKWIFGLEKISGGMLAMFGVLLVFD